MKLLLSIAMISFWSMNLLADRPEKPNVIMVLTDDLGWQDVKCYDIDEPSPMETPNLDAFAKKGVQFWQAYSPAPTCAPSRAAILSGDHPARAQMTHVSGGKPPHPHDPTRWGLMSPWYSARMPAETVCIAEALKAYGYTTGHSGKWHIGKNHHGYPQPEDQGFDYTRSSRGVQTRMTPDRLTGFATNDANDPYRLDENGMAFDQTHHDAMTFVKENHEQPFFLYYATWLVHAPIVMRSEALLRKYEKKLGVTLSEEHKTTWKKGGQTNPFYCAMVEQMDYYMGQLFTYLEETDDPRWPGHKLSENTYVIFTSDNGGMEGSPNYEIYTDNYPLDQGKISVMEGGTRVPLLIAGPGIAANQQSDVMVNGLDFYPTILSLTGAPLPKGKQFDGFDISSLLLGDPSDRTRVKDAEGWVRDTMIWHFPNSAAMESSIREGDYKLVRNYNYMVDLNVEPLELYRLYNSEDGTQKREDLEEANNLIKTHYQKAKYLDARLGKMLAEMKASFPYYNPNFVRPIPGKDKVCKVLGHTKEGAVVSCTYEEQGAKVTAAKVVYTLNGGEYYEEWFSQDAEIVDGKTVRHTLPKGCTHYFFNLIDENHFMLSFPAVKINKGTRDNYTEAALKAQ